jgi:proteasome lid subunit RPN8/RPN11
MGIFKKKKNEIKPKVWKIKKKCLDLIFECARSSFPNEFGGLLRVDSEIKDTIIELIILPGTISGEAHALFKLHMLPIDFSVVGTVHSHPSPYPIPSDADLQFFRKSGKIHIIVANPFDMNSWKAYDYDGNVRELTVV